MLRGSFELIGDKSISHRAIMFSSISKGYNKISNFLIVSLSTLYRLPSIIFVIL